MKDLKELEKAMYRDVHGLFLQRWFAILSFYAIMKNAIGDMIEREESYCRLNIKYINASDKPTKRRLKEAIEKIPFGDIKKLQGIDNGYRLRVGDLRVLFSIEDDKIYIDNIIPRGQAYKRL